MADKFGAGIIQGSTSVSIPVELWTTTSHAPLSSIVFGSVTAAYWRQGAALVTIAVVSLTAANSAWTSGGWVRLANDPNGSKTYRLDVPDAAFASGVDFVKVVVLTSGGFAQTDPYPLIGISDTAVQVALSSLTVAVASVIAAIPTRATASVWTQTVANNIDTTITSRASASLWTATVAGFIDTNITSRASASLWTATVAGNIDTTITSRASASLWTSTVAGRIDVSITSVAASLALTAAGMGTLTANVDSTITSRASASLWTSTIAGRIDTNVTTAASAASLALTAFDPVTATQANALAASLALTAFDPVTKTQANALAASLALTAAGMGTLVANVDTTITSRASASLWTSTVAGRIDLSISSAGGGASDSSIAVAVWAASTGLYVDAPITSRASAALWTSTIAGRIDVSISSAGVSAGSIAAAVWAASSGLYVDAPVTSRSSATVWTASLALYLSNLAESGVPKNTALANFEFLMVSTDGLTAMTGLSVTAQRSIDGAAFSACANAVSEIGSGIYVINLAATDLNGDVITLRFSAASALDRFITVKTTP